MSSKKKPERLRIFTKARHEFTTTEWQGATRELTRTMELVTEKENEIKAKNKALKAELQALQAKVNELANNVRAGGEDRDTEATVEFKPKQAKKIIRFHCPGDSKHDTVIREEPMQQVDYEGLLELGDEPTPPDKGKKADKAPENGEEPPATGETPTT